jgi:fluoride exporter
VNLSGCFLVGMVVSALVDRHHTPEWLRVGLVLGFLGVYTTFSTFAVRTACHITAAKDRWELAAALVVSVNALRIGPPPSASGSRASRVRNGRRVAVRARPLHGDER